MDIVQLLNLILIILVVLIVFLVIMYFIFSTKNKNKKATNNQNTGKKQPNSNETMRIESMNNFLEFDEIKDNMIIRKNRTQYVMVIQCQGVNYDLMSEDEKIAIEEGFVQFLNTLRFPIQLYVQTRSLNLRDIIEEYKVRMKAMEDDINKVKLKIEEATKKGNDELVEKLEFEERRKENVLEYGADIADYIGRLSLNNNILQQKTYVIVSYYAAEAGDLANYSKDEIDNLCFSELYTRCQSVTRTLASAEVVGRILESEELAELLYVAYNRDDAEIMQLSKALDAEYDALYSTSKDVLEKKQEKLDEKIEVEAIELATNSIVDADKELEEQREKNKKIESKALDLLDDYKDQMDKELYEESKKQVKKKSKKAEEEIEEKVKKKTKKESNSEV